MDDIKLSVPKSKTNYPVLKVRNLDVKFDSINGPVNAVRGVDFDLYPGEILGIVGESGSGKSVTCKALTKLLDKKAMATGSVIYDGIDLFKLKPKEINRYRGKQISMIFQDPMSNLDQIRTIFKHMKEVIGAGNKRIIAKNQLTKLHIKDSESRLNDYPFEFSGGMAQRVQIAMALINNPKVLIADEPTTALDVTIQDKILQEFLYLKKNYGLSIILVTHDLGVVSQCCDRVAVMYHGRIVESGKVSDIIKLPYHPYTRALLNSVPTVESYKYKLEPIKGSALSSSINLAGCDFAPRCMYATDKCKNNCPTTEAINNRVLKCFYPLQSKLLEKNKVNRIEFNINKKEEIVKINNLVCSFFKKDFSGKMTRFNAVDDISFTLNRGEILGIVGESGSGKSTVAKAIMGIINPTSGNIICNNISRNSPNWNMFNHAKKIQYVFQDPLGSLDPRMNILDQVCEPLEIHCKELTKKERIDKATQVLNDCGLGKSCFDRKPKRLSGGERQRAVLARALVINPEILICDEPVSAMDVSIQAQIINLVESLARERNIGVVFISHDLRVVNNICDNLAVMNNGKILEKGSIKEVFENPIHPYTKKLLNSIPNISITKKNYQEVPKEHLINQKFNGCPFYYNCDRKTEICKISKPIMEEGVEHGVACFNIE